MSQKRLFLMLNDESKERVVLFKTRYEQMMPLERQAFLQELGLVSTVDLDEEATRRAKLNKLVHYSTERLNAVRARDPSYVVLEQNPLPDEGAANTIPGSNQPHYTEAMPDAIFRRMLSPAIFGEQPVKISKQRKSLYEKIGSTDCGAEDEGEEESEEEVIDAEEATPKEIQAIGEKGKYLYRSNAYQILRLAHSFPGHVNTCGLAAADSEAATTTMNVTGIPLYEDELRDWYNALDTEGTGSLDVEAFTKFMRSLDRDFGVEAEYDVLEKEGMRLSVEGKLPFEAFAYLVMRFARA